MSQRKRGNELFEYYSKLVAGEGDEEGEGSNKRMKPKKSTEMEGEGSNKRMKPKKSTEIIEIRSPGSPIPEHLEGIIIYK
jgi:hypothetical protein